MPRRPDIRAEFPPTLREVMLRPWWIGMLLFALLVAAVFAWLGQWQLSRSIDTSPPEPGSSEVVQPLAAVLEPGVPIPDPVVGQRVEVSGSFVPGDFLVLSSRFNDGEEGYWVTGQFRTDASDASDASPAPDTNDTDAALAVAVGWTPDRAEADRAAAELNAAAPADLTLIGRLIPDEGADVPERGADPLEMSRMSSAVLLGQWTDTDASGVYRANLTSAEPFAGLVAITSPAPEQGSSVNWLNIFYALEWAVFAGFAFYMWSRLAKDAWEKELEAFEDARDAEPQTA